MGCGGCARRREKALRRKVVETSPPPPPEPRLFCEACNAYHVESEYRNCPFRIQLERQKAREERVKRRLAEKEVAQPIAHRRGRQVYQAFTPSTNPAPTRKKW